MKKINLKIIFRIGLAFMSLFFIAGNLSAQVEDSIAVEEEVVVESDDDEGKAPVRNPWATGTLIDNQTTEGPNAGIIEYVIYHRFGKIKNIKDIFGIYAASNIKMGLSYGITKNISVGFATEKNNKMQEFYGKYKIISQSRDGKIPVSVSYFGNVVIDARDKEFFGTDYAFKHRLSFFNQVIVGRKMTNALSLQAAFSLSHFNMVTETVLDPNDNAIGKWKNDYVGIMAGGRYKFYNNMSAIVEYHYPLAINELWENQFEPKPGLGIGLEIGTSTHAFQIFASNYDDLISQENYSHNLNDMTDGGWLFGFNIIVRF
jgi:hypothetical protein